MAKRTTRAATKAAKQTISRLDDNPQYMSGQSAIVIFDRVQNYADATFESISAGNPMSVGNIEGGTTTLTSEAGEETTINNEQGVVVISESGSGRDSFEFTIMSTSEHILKRFMGGKDLLIGASDPDDFFTVKTLVGVGNDSASFESPIAVLDSSKTQMLFYPRAKISSSFTGSPGAGGYTGVAVTVVALDINTPNLKTVMKIKGTGASFDEDPSPGGNDKFTYILPFSLK